MTITRHLSIARLAAVTSLALAAAMPAAHAATHVGVSVSVNQPGFYGRVDVGQQPPVLLYPQPVIIQQSPYGMVQHPIYMRVPPGHSANWGRYCNRYGACGQPVYFVRDVPQQRGGRDERWEERREHEHGRGHDHGWRDGDRGERGGHGRGHD